jgi:hydrogenase nickel incorporation protein HypB
MKGTAGEVMGYRPLDGRPKRVSVETSILARNALDAQRNRSWLAARGVAAFNLLSSPGSGKTTLLERTLRELQHDIPMCVIEGDQETSLDADRVRATGCDALQINTGAGCHLDAAAVGRALRELAPRSGSAVMIENVGNLICPALFDLGENARVVVISVTEGDDKPLKYPHMFRAADLVLVNKIDLLPYVPFDVQRCIGHVHRLNPEAEVIELAALKGEGMTRWYDWLRDKTKLSRTIVRDNAVG